MSTAPDNTIANLAQGSWEATRNDRKGLIAFLVLYVIATVLDLLAPWAIGYTLGIFVQDGFTDEALRQGFWAIVLYTTIRLANAVAHHLARYIQLGVAYSAKMETLTRVFSDLMRFPLRWHIESHSGENLSKLHRSAGAVEGVIGTYVWQVVEGVVKVGGATIALFTLDFRVALNVLIMAVVTIVVMVAFNRRLIQKIRQNNAFANKISRICVDYLFNTVTVKMLGLEDSAVKYLRAERDTGLRLAKKIAKYQELKWSTTGVGYAIVIGSSLYIYFLHHRGLSGAFDVAQVYVLLNYLDRIFQAIGSFTGYYGGILDAATSYEDAVSIQRRASRLHNHTIPSVDAQWKTMKINSLNFSFVAGERRGIDAASLEFARGEKIAVVGPSGGGKSTLLKLFAGILEPDAYSIATDIQPVLSNEQLASQCLLIPQEPEIFSETFRFNLTMGEEFDDRELSFFLQLCRLEEVLSKLPNGWESNLAEKGLNLSVGEKQRCALARGLLRAGRRPILLLDEPTSSLDPKTEKEVFQALLYYFTDRTVITACHRLALVPLFDKIIFISQGRIAEIGSFQELIALRGAFFKAWEDFERKVTRGQPE